MQSFKTVDEYILNADRGREILMVLRDLLLTTELTETVKWGGPVYTINGKNVVGIGAFKSYSGLWFYQGALLTDRKKVLIRSLEGRTKALRQWRFQSPDEIDPELLLEYVHEAIENQKQNKEIKADRNKPLVIPDELTEAFEEDPILKSNFQSFTKGKQREFADYISHAKQEKTRLSRLQKVIPLIQQNIGLNDKYRK
ncbi:YdeI/OmpD-associated family protein [Maribellus mangrovi]|uniref:YdeI/OmpD-associated family protein n=1 Tax=Maribellus mangrovi TaxID=3133146 RepID=UPI0030EC0849